MEWYMPTEYIDIENVSGFFNEKRIFIDKISNVILSDKPVELQELTFFDKGRGHRTALSCRPTLSFDFTANEQSPPFISKLHKHDYYEIIIAAVGIVEMQIESRLCQLNEGDVCVLNRSTQHAEHFKTGQKVFYITITPEYIKNWPKDEGTGLPRLIAKLFDKGMDVPLYQNKDYIIAAGSNNDSLPGILSVIENIREEFEGKKPGYHFFVRGLLYRFFCTITNSKLYSIEYIDLGMDEGFSLAFSAKQIIDKNLRRTSKDEIAQNCNIMVNI
ncbi:MAG: AraC family ligand binding domain-containing protein [Clostridiales bacterium]|jgi:hypothetical protein|nr:AraC family ligand binding domain-containing protein [Clostridiales bacterium]